MYMKGAGEICTLVFEEETRCTPFVGWSPRRGELKRQINHKRGGTRESG